MIKRRKKKSLFSRFIRSLQKKWNKKKNISQDHLIWLACHGLCVYCIYLLYILRIKTNFMPQKRAKRAWGWRIKGKKNVYWKGDDIERTRARERKREKSTQLFCILWRQRVSMRILWSKRVACSIHWHQPHWRFQWIHFFRFCDFSFWGQWMKE